MVTRKTDVHRHQRDRPAAPKVVQNIDVQVIHARRGSAKISLESFADFEHQHNKNPGGNPGYCG
jgi:hypothetical protein